MCVCLCLCVCVSVSVPVSVSVSVSVFVSVSVSFFPVFLSLLVRVRLFVGSSGFLSLLVPTFVLSASENLSAQGAIFPLLHEAFRQKGRPVNRFNRDPGVLPWATRKP